MDDEDYVPTTANCGRNGAKPILIDDYKDEKEDDIGTTVLDDEASSNDCLEKVDDNNQRSSVNDDEYNDNSVEKTIRIMEMNNRCMHPHHWHSFRPIHLMVSVLNRVDCIFCNEKISLVILPSFYTTSSDVVQCVACNVYAHRSCSTTRSDLWIRRKCSVNASYIMNNELFLEQQQQIEELQNQQYEYNKKKKMSQHQPNQNDDNEQIITKQQHISNDMILDDDDSMNHDGDALTTTLSNNHNTSNDENSPKQLQQQHHQSFMKMNTILQEQVIANFRKHTPRNHQRPHEEQEQQDEHELTFESQQQQPSEVSSSTRRSFNDNQDAPMIPAISESSTESNNSILNFARGTIEKVKGNFGIRNSASGSINGSEMNETIDTSNDCHNDNENWRNEKDKNGTVTPMNNNNNGNNTTTNKLNVAAVAGGIAGGLAGLVVAGPAGAYAGVVAASYLVEGTVVLGVVAAGIATGSMTGQHIEQQIKNGTVLEILPRRILTMGGTNGSIRKVLLVRPNIQIDMLWENTIMVEARKTAPKSLSSTMSNSNLTKKLLGHFDNNNRKKRDYNDLDIVQSGENELSTSEKVLLLVNRTLNDRNSLPGHVYRYLIDSFEDRCHTRQAILESYNSIQALSPRARRDDAHAVIKHVTATLLETRSELFGSTPYITELAASAVEALVFGHLYDLIYEEIVQETAVRDKKLLQRVLLLQHEFSQSNINNSSSSNDNEIDGTSSNLSQSREQTDESLVTEKNTNIMDQFGSDDNDGHSDSSSNPSKSPQHQQSLAEFMQSSMSISQPALLTLRHLPTSHSACDKLHDCVRFLEHISEQYTLSTTTAATNDGSPLSADSLLKMVCQHLILHILLQSNDCDSTLQGTPQLQDLNGQIVFLEEFARDEQLLRGREGYALVTLQASLHFLNTSSINDLKYEILNENEDEFDEKARRRISDAYDGDNECGVLSRRSVDVDEEIVEQRDVVDLVTTDALDVDDTVTNNNDSGDRETYKTFLNDEVIAPHNEDTAPMESTACNNCNEKQRKDDTSTFLDESLGMETNEVNDVAIPKDQQIHDDDVIDQDEVETDHDDGSVYQDALNEEDDPIYR